MSTPAATDDSRTIGGTPLRALRVPIGGRSVRIWLKLEADNPFGSIKARTAASLLEDLEKRGELHPGRRVVESTSGNLGVALAGLCHARGRACTLVVEPSTPRSSIDRMVAYGVEVVMVPEQPGGATLRARLAAVQEILARDPAAVWANQYGSPANPRVHEVHTAAELLGGAPEGGYDAVAVAVSTGGTLAGISAHLRRHAPRTRVIAVDAVGSAALGGAPAERPHKLAGFGSGQPSGFVRPHQWDDAVRVRDEDAAAACAQVRGRTGLSLGGSSGAAVLAAVTRALLDPRLAEMACVCPDSGDKYPALHAQGPPGRAAGPPPTEWTDVTAAALDRLGRASTDPGDRP